MTPETQMLWLYGGSAIILAIPGLYYLLFGKNLIRILIAVELLFKAVTLLMALAGQITGKTGLAQSMIITLILIEVLVIAVGAGIVIVTYRRSESLDVRHLSNLKG